jgi:hypothetical protein
MGKRSVRPFAVSHSTVYIIFPPRIFCVLHSVHTCTSLAELLSIENSNSQIVLAVLW